TQEGGDLVPPLEIINLRQPSEVRESPTGSSNSSISPATSSGARPTSPEGAGPSMSADRRHQALRGRAPRPGRQRPCSWPPDRSSGRTPATLFAVPPGHDSWVVGDERYTSLHLLGAGSYSLPATS